MHNFEIVAFRIKMEYKYAELCKSSDFNHHEEFFPLHRRDGGRIRCWSPYYGYIDSSASLAQRRLSARMRKEKVKLNRTMIVKICPYRDR